MEKMDNNNSCKNEKINTSLNESIDTKMKK